MPLPEAAEAPPRPRAAHAWAEWLLIVLVLLVAGGDPPPHRNEAHYLARLKHYWQPEWIEGDLFLESPDAHFTVVWLLGWTTRWMSLDGAAWVGRGISWALLAWGWRRLSWRVAPWPLLSVLGAGLFVLVTEQFHFAGEWVVGGFEAKTLAYGLVLLALADALDERWNRAWVLLGGASALHVLVGGWSVLALLFSWAVCRRRPTLAAMAPGLALGGALSLLGVVPALQLNSGVPPDVIAEANQIYVFQRLPHHLALLGMPIDWLANRAARHAAILIVLALLHRVALPRLDRREELRLVVWWAWGAAVFCGMGLLIEVALQSRPDLAAALLRYYFFRLSDIAAPVAVVLMGSAAAEQGLRAGHRHTRAALVAAGVLTAAYLAGYTRDRSIAPDAPADVKMSDKVAWVEICEWIAANTPRDALFLTPRVSHSFKWRAGRAEVVTYKDIPQDAPSLVRWWERYNDVYGTGETHPDGRPVWAPSLASRGATRLRELAETYGARYALSQSPADRAGHRGRHWASLPVVHRVGPYTLHDLADTP